MNPEVQAMIDGQEMISQAIINISIVRGKNETKESYTLLSDTIDILVSLRGKVK